MTTIRKYGLFALLLTISLVVEAKNYYVSNGGNDKSKGTSPEESIQTLERVNELKLKAGDRVLFRAGDTFAGTLVVKSSGKAGKPIVYSSYGTGDIPVITGFIKITGFTREEGNVYSADCNQNIEHLYENGLLKTLARFPNVGYLTMDGGGNDHLVDYDLPFTANELRGATVRLQTNNWSYLYRDVIDYTEQKLVFDSILAAIPNKYRICKQGGNYYLDGKKAFLDRDNEWVYHSGEKKVYIYSSRPVDNTKEYLGSYGPYGIIVENNIENITIENLRFNGLSNTGILVKGGNKEIIVRNSAFRDIGKYGVYVEERSEGIHVTDNYFNNILGNAIRYFETKNSIIENNKIHNTGLVLGYGVSGVNGATGICVVNREHPYNDKELMCHTNLIRNNYVDSIGYNGIRFEGWNTACENNVVKNGLLTMHDGGLIYIWGKDTTYTFDNVIRNNILADNMGGLEDFGKRKLAVGIYLDNRVKDILVENNIVVNAGSGILTNAHSIRSTIKNNLVYGNEIGINLIEWDKPEKGDFAHVVTGNEVFCMKNLGSALIVANHKNTSIDPGTIENNLYCSPNEMFYIKKLIVGDGYKAEKNYTLNVWQEEMGFDRNSGYLEPVKDGSAYPYSKIIINETDLAKTFELDEIYSWMDKEKNVLENKVTLDPRSAVVLFYK